MTIPLDYEERIYAGVLGKIIGIDFGSTMEGWSYEEVLEHMGEITGYTNENINNKKGCVMPLPNQSDDITGMFSSIRAMSDNKCRRDLSAADIGRTWLNYHVLDRTGMYWGAMGLSSERTAMVRLLSGVEAPRSGSIELNGTMVAQQIGGRIFVDAWPMIAPGDPVFAADLARRAASVTHDGESIYGAQMVAAMEAQAFVESDMNKLLDIGISVIPKDSIIYQSTQDVREWHAAEPDWKKTRVKMNERYGYDKYGGGCHIVPNHAVVVLGLLYGNGDFNESMNITAAAGLDTDCNCSAVGCILGIRDGLDAFNGTPDLRTPNKDRIFVSTTEGGRSITDAITESYHIANIGRSLASEDLVAPKNGAKFHFDLPGSIQCFEAEKGENCANEVIIENAEGHSSQGTRSLAIRCKNIGANSVARAATATFVPLKAMSAMTRRHERSGWKYKLVASPSLYAGQTVRAEFSADADNSAPVSCKLYVRSYAQDDTLNRTSGEEIMMAPGETKEITWCIPDMKGAPIAEIGLEIGASDKTDGTVYLDYLTWNGSPDVNLQSPAYDNNMWDNAWAPAVDQYCIVDGIYRIVQDTGRGMIIQGTRDWTDYKVTAPVASQMATTYGIAARVQGHRRYYGLLLCNDGTLRIEKVIDTPEILAQIDFEWKPKSTYFTWDADGTYELSIEVRGNTIIGFVDGKEMLRAVDKENTLTGGGVALVIEEGHLKTNGVTVKPI